MAGVNKDEGSILVPRALMKHSTFTKQDFIKFVYTIDFALFHNIDVDNVTQFYLSDVNDNDSETIKWKFYDFFGDILIKCPTYLFAKRYAEHSSDKTKLYFYELTHAFNLTDKDLGIFHGAELWYLFGQPLLDPTHFSQEDKEFSAQVIEFWTNFAKHG